MDVTSNNVILAGVPGVEPVVCFGRLPPHGAAVAGRPGARQGVLAATGHHNVSAERLRAPVYR